MLKIQGKISWIGEVKETEDYSVLEFQVDEQDVEYPNRTLFSLFKKGEWKKIADNFATENPVGTNVVVEYNTNTKEWKDRRFGSNNAFSIKKVEGEKEDNQIEYPEEESVDSIPFK